MSKVVVRIPTPLRQYTEGRDFVEVTGNNLGDCLGQVISQCPGISERLFGSDGELHHFVNIYINGEDVHFLQGLATTVDDGDEVSIVPAVAGGSLRQP